MLSVRVRAWNARAACEWRSLAAWRVAALLRYFLVFELDGGDTGGLIAHHGVANVQQAAIARIGIGDDRGGAALAEAAHPPDHVGKGGDAGIGDAEMRGDGAVAGGVQGV